MAAGADFTGFPSNFESVQDQSIPLLCCEWMLDTEEMCGLATVTPNDLIAHVRSDHLTPLCLRCSWRLCQFSSERATELTCHVAYHAYHSFLKNTGLDYQQKNSLPVCQLSTDLVNVIPCIGERAECLWQSRGGGGQCKQVFDNVMIFYSHVKDHVMSTKEVAKCGWAGCDFKARNKSKLQDHVRSHTQEKVIACPVCGALFANNTKFRDHLNRQVTVSDSSLSCSFCHKPFSNERLLQQHVRRHINTQKCPHCEMTCNSPSRLLSHIAYRHSDSKPHECPVCQKRFKTQYVLSDHLETHQGKELVCTVPGCRYQSRTVRGWQQHVRSMHTSDQLLYCCHICQMRFPLGVKLTAHLKESHGFSLPPGHCRFRYIVGEDGMRRLQTVRLDDNSIATVTSDRSRDNTTPTSNHGDETTPTNDREPITESQEVLC